MALRDSLSYSTYVTEDELERPQRDALVRAMEAMPPPGLVQQGTMLREHLSGLGPVRAAARTAEDLRGLFDRLGPLGPGDVANPVQLGAKAGAALASGIVGDDADAAAPARAGRDVSPAADAFDALGDLTRRVPRAGREALDRGADAIGSGFRQADAAQRAGREGMVTATPLEAVGQTAEYLTRPVRETVGPVAGAMGAAFGRGRETARGALGEGPVGQAAGAGLGALGALPAGYQQLTEQGAMAAGFTREQARFMGRLAAIVSPGVGGLEQGVGRAGQLATAGLGAIGAAKGALETEGGPGARLAGATERGLDWAQYGQPVGALAEATGLARRAGEAWTDYAARAQRLGATPGGAFGADAGRAVDEGQDVLRAQAASRLSPGAEARPGSRTPQTHPEAYPSGTGIETQRTLPGFREPEPIGPVYRPPGATRAGETAPPSTWPPDPVEVPGASPGTSTAAGGRLRLPTWGEAADVATSMPLLTPSSQATNLLGGAFRTFQRFAEDSAGAFWTDRAVRESLADFAGMVTELPAALRDIRGSTTRGGSAAARRQMGATGESLVNRSGAGPLVATLGTRLNAAGDDFWRRLNTAGASARAATRGITDPNEVADLGGQAADFVSFTGKNSSLAEFLGSFRQRLDDPAAGGAEKAFSALMVGLTPYVRTPERILKSSVSLATDPVVLPLQRAFGKGRLGEALRAGDQEAKREFAGRMTVGTMTLGLAGLAYADGKLFGAPPRDAKTRRELEANGAQWRTIYGVPLNKLGAFGQAMSGVGTVLLDAQVAAEKGVDPSDLVRAGISSAMRWALDESYLREVERFASDIGEGRGAEAAERLAINVAGRPAAALAGAAGAFDPVEREVRGTGAELVNRLPGGRYALPERIDPATGRPVERAGSGVGRLFFGSQGATYSTEGKELARLGVTAREFKPQDTVYGNVQTPEARRLLQVTYGRLAGQYLRDAMGRPDYRTATDEQQAATLERQLALAARVADLEVGDRVARDPQARFELEWARTPQYRGVEGTPDRIARQNLEIREAKQLLSEYQRRDGETPGRYRFYEEHPDLIDFARRPEVPERSLAEEKEAVRRRTGAPEQRSAALPGAGNRVLASAPFVAPEAQPQRQQQRAQEQFDIQREIEGLIARTRARSSAPTGGGGGFRFTAP